MRVSIQFIFGVLLVFCLILDTNTQVSAQSFDQDKGPTGQIDKYGKHPKHAKKYPLTIYVKKGEKKLIGNPCAVEETRRLGFEYQPRHRHEGFGSEWKRCWHNTWVKTRIFFTKNPFWKIKIKKEFKKCATQSGDHRG